MSDTNTLRDAVAAELLVISVGDDWELWAKYWTPERVAEMSLAEHDGDCTKQPYTCARCLSEQYLKAADHFMERFSTLRKGPSHD